MQNTIHLTILIIIFIASGCQISNVPATRTILDGKKTYEEFISSNYFPYSMQEDRKNQIINNYSSLRLGMTKQDVNSFLGDPDFSQHLYTKENPGKYIGSEWSYYFYKRDPNLVNEKIDIGIFIFFNSNQKVHWVVPKNFKGLTEKGSPSREGS